MKHKKILMLTAVALCGMESTFAQTWIETSQIPVWMVAASADGQNQVAAVAGGPIYTSTNSGTDWTLTSAPIEFWESVASSADGTKLVAATGTMRGAVYTSTNSGADWTTNNIPIYIGFYNWTTVASSADGTKLVAAGIYSPIYTSTNSGATWVSNSSPTLAWRSVASSADGSKLVAITQYADVYTSTNSGILWTESTNFAASTLGAPSQIVASSADGTKLVAVIWNNGIYKSTNAGASWTQTIAPNLDWSGVACSAGGTKLVAVSGGAVYVSADSGESWVSNSIPDNNWTYAAVSADGDQLIAVGGAGIWTAQSTPAPQINLTQVNGSLALSWIIPSTNFVLQQNSDIPGTNWVNVTNTPVLNFTNLQEQVILTPSNSHGFYRLATPLNLIFTPD
jgi:hypothetical protein